jgi:CubicO group peptidase (beta-lactamase class C family)
VDGQEVVNLYGIYDSSLGSTYNSHSIQNIFSSSKAMTSIIVAILVDRGYLTYNQPIVEIWPEFKTNDKQLRTIEDLMKHEAGMEKFPFALRGISRNRFISFSQRNH